MELYFWGDETGNVVSSPFILTAYAISPDDGGTITNVLEKDKQISISRFVSENGLIGLVVSGTKLDSSMLLLIAIMAVNNDHESCIAEISGIQTIKHKTILLCSRRSNDLEHISNNIVEGIVEKHLENLERQCIFDEFVYFWTGYAFCTLEIEALI